MKTDGVLVLGDGRREHEALMGVVGDEVGGLGEENDLWKSKGESEERRKNEGGEGGELAFAPSAAAPRTTNSEILRL